YDMPISNSETDQTEVAELIPVYSSSLFFKLHNVFKNRTTFSILLWLYENKEGLNVEDVIAGFNLSRSSAFRYCRTLADAKVVETIWHVTKKDIREYGKNRFVISEYGRKLVDVLFSLEKGVQPTYMADSESKPSAQKEWTLKNQVSTKLENLITGRLEDYVHTKKFENIIFTLMSNEYADIKDRNVHIIWARTGASAVIVWSQNKTDVIRCNIAVTNWPEPAIFGLLSHELSHIALGADLHSELQADKDVIARELGYYLAIERAFTRNYADHIIREGEDRYLGYTSIRKLLKAHEVQQLDSLMSDFGLEPS
ncbi:MAG: helix-turn-helix domain-containing protein, partial [Candidatus Thorarchaeota archaeon]|nr:helix-turn-helix domain-containing protein [Candidatus Thorarchaeota archaeon]